MRNIKQIYYLMNNIEFLKEFNPDSSDSLSFISIYFFIN